MSVYLPDVEGFRVLARQGGSVPVYRRLLADQMTPVSAFAALSGDADRAFLLESVVGGEHIARYSFVGADPVIHFTAKGSDAVVQRTDGGRQILGAPADPLGELKKLLDRYRGTEGASPVPSSLPRFTGGAVGYAGYDTVRYYEDLPLSPQDDRALDDLDFGIYESLLAFDQVNKTLLVISHADASGPDSDAAYRDACRRIDELVAKLRRPNLTLNDELSIDTPALPTWTSTFERTAFETAVRRAKDYIRAGDIFQVVLSQRLRTITAADPFNIYRALRVVNPSPFMFFLKSPKCTLVGASPEVLCRVEDSVVLHRPLAGTRRRGESVKEDDALERELLADAKDRAEHVMLVDLGRNDIGRIAAPGSVQLDELMTVERYSHVMHLSSRVTGRIATGFSAFDALRASLPVGTVSGAPKIRAMEIIDELEPVRRGPYGGAVGYFDFSGNMDTCIALRTMVITPGADGAWTVDMQAGAGVVADSDPAAEYEETINKAKAMLVAVGMASMRG